MDADAGTRVELRGEALYQYADQGRHGNLVLAATTAISSTSISMKAPFIWEAKAGRGNVLVLGNNDLRNQVVSLQALTKDLVLTNDFSWLNTNLNITGQHAITLAPRNQVTIDLNGDRRALIPS